VATLLMCGGTYNDDLTVRLLLNMSVKQFRRSVESERIQLFQSQWVTLSFAKTKV